MDATKSSPGMPVRLLRVQVRGAVQGVGFRPFVYRLAADEGLAGWVANSAQGVSIEVEGPSDRLGVFLLRLTRERPERAFIQSVEHAMLDPAGHGAFEIRPSDAAGEKSALILPDIATCGTCLGDILDPAGRRHRYPFTNCTHCGPRFSIIERLPYDRSNTTMRGFAMCAACAKEYGDPADRRFHAQPNACPGCGPGLEAWDASGAAVASGEDALLETAAAIRRGAIVAVKGLGGFHLVVDARSSSAVALLRERKRRDSKPFAVMVPSLEAAREACEVSELEAWLLSSPAAPIVLLRRYGKGIAPEVAPRNPNLGLMLPYTPLHHLLLGDLGFPVVATSGNLSDEPICTGEREALDRLGGIADVFLVHNRPIARHVDDSVVRVMADRPVVLRRARGYAPLPVPLASPPALAVGGHLKNTVALSMGGQAVVSQHVGDLETEEAVETCARVAADLQKLHEVRPESVVCDAHPDYCSTRFAEGLGLPVLRVQHHHAHVLSCMAENELAPPVLGVAWDGTGHGPDGTVWGGEFLKVTSRGIERVAHLRTFRLPGGEKAIREPRRAALGLLYEIHGDGALERAAPGERGILKQMLEGGINSPRTSSAGRLFDAVAAIAGVCFENRHEGQAAMELEYAMEGVETDERYPFGFSGGVIDWEPMIRGLLADAGAGRISAKFHNTLVEMIVAAARAAGEERVALSGGCFQNRALTERTIRRLSEEGFRPYGHQRVPPNDGGIALGQLAALARESTRYRRSEP